MNREFGKQLYDTPFVNWYRNRGLNDSNLHYFNATDMNFINIHIFPFNTEYEEMHLQLKKQYMHYIFQQCTSNPHKQYFINGIKSKVFTYLKNNPEIKQISNSLCRYYEHLDQQFGECLYDNPFINWCKNSILNDIDMYQVNVHDEDEVDDEFDEDVYIHCTYKWRFLKLYSRQNGIFPMIEWNWKDIDLKDANIYYNFALWGLKNMFKFRRDELARIRYEYAQQCPEIWNNGLKWDLTTLLLLAVGARMKFPYLIYLVDDYNRYRIDTSHSYKQMEYEYITAWLDSNRHAFDIQKANIKVDTRALQQLENAKEAVTTPIAAINLLRCAVPSFRKRICPTLPPLSRIHDSLEITANYYVAVTELIDNILQKPGCTPTQVICYVCFTSMIILICFALQQIDFCIVFDACKIRTIADTEFDEDDDDDEYTNYQKAAFSPSIGEIKPVGSIERKLIANELRYTTLNSRSWYSYDYKSALLEFLIKLQSQYDSDGCDESLTQNRLVFMVDRRRQAKDDEIHNDQIYLFEPPMNCRTKPSNAVPEWGLSIFNTNYNRYVLIYNYIITGFNASMTSILPNETYTESLDLYGSSEYRHPLQEENISAIDICDTPIMTFSFQIFAEKNIRSYLFWQGYCVRFMPEDIYTILPKLFNPKWREPHKKKEKKSNGWIKKRSPALLIDAKIKIEESLEIATTYYKAVTEFIDYVIQQNNSKYDRAALYPFQVIFILSPFYTISYKTILLG